VLDAARAQPERLWLGLDPVAGAMANASRTAAAPPRKGGLPNVRFIRGAAESLPGPFSRRMDEIRINYPWGSLLRIMVLPDVELLRNIVVCGKSGASFTIFLNYSTVAIGLAIVEMSENVMLRYVSGKYVRESEYVPPRGRYHVDNSRTTTRDLPSGRMRIVAYSPYDRVRWSMP